MYFVRKRYTQVGSLRVSLTLIVHNFDQEKTKLKCDIRHNELVLDFKLKYA